MAVHRYPFPVDEYTLNLIRQLNEDALLHIFSTILANKSVDFNIDFTELDALTRLREFYDLLYTYQLDSTGLFDRVLVRLLNASFSRAEHPENTYVLIQLVDYIQPDAYYPTLETLVTYIPVQKDFKGPDGLNLHFHLISAIMSMDRSYSLYPYLKHLSPAFYFPEYFQITIRYIYMYLDQQVFNDFMHHVFDEFGREEIRNALMLIVDECAYYKKSYILLFNWLLLQCETLKLNNENVFFLMIHDIKLYLQGVLSDSKQWEAYKPLSFLVQSFEPDFKLTSYMFREAAGVSEKLLQNKDTFFFYLGQQDGVVIDEDMLLLSDSNTIQFNENLSYHRFFLKGYQRKQRTELNNTPLDRIIIIPA